MDQDNDGYFPVTFRYDQPAGELRAVAIEDGIGDIEGDARTALRRIRRRFTRVITSPPYLGMRTYLPDQWLRYWALGGEPSPA